MKTARIKSISTKIERTRITKRIAAMAVLLLIISSTCVFSSATIHNNAYAQGTPEQKKVLRLGYFPNVNHAQAIIGFQTGDFKKQLRDNIDVQAFTFNAGP